MLMIATRENHQKLQQVHDAPSKAKSRTLFFIVSFLQNKGLMLNRYFHRLAESVIPHPREVGSV
jgi:hypothetical protein